MYEGWQAGAENVYTWNPNWKDWQLIITQGQELIFI